MSKTIIKDMLFKDDVMFFKGDSTELLKFAKAIQYGENYYNHKCNKTELTILAPYESFDSVVTLNNVVSEETKDLFKELRVGVSKKNEVFKNNIEHLAALFNKTIRFKDDAEPKSDVYIVSLSGSLGNAFNEDYNQVIEMIKNLAQKTGTTIIVTGSSVFGVMCATPEELEMFNKSEEFNEYATVIL